MNAEFERKGKERRKGKRCKKEREEGEGGREKKEK